MFTSAGSVYAENEGGEVDETSEVARTERSGKLLDGEEAVIRAGGSVLRGITRVDTRLLPSRIWVGFTLSV